MDHRRSPRLELQLPCMLRVANGSGATIAGITANVSRRGALIRCQPNPAKRRLLGEGETVRVEIALAENASARRSVSGQATIVRIDTARDREVLVAVDFGRLEFGRWEEQPLELESSSRHARAG